MNDNEPRPYTEKEILEQFLDEIRGLIRYWATLPKPFIAPGETDVQARLSGLAFSILAMLDGCHGSMPAFRVIPCPNQADEQFNRDEGENWYPYPAQTNDIDISGGLHEQLTAKGKS